MNRMIVVVSLLMLVAGALSPWDVSEATSSPIHNQAVYQLLQAGDSDAVRALPLGEREILLAVMAMNQGETKKALALLSGDAVKKNRLAALIRAEAYRKQSVEAAERAGHYAHAANDDIGRLKQARISSGLDEANQRLAVFVASLHASQTTVPEGEPAVAEQLALNPTALKPTALKPVASKPAMPFLKSAKLTAWPSIVGRPTAMLASNESMASIVNTRKTPVLHKTPALHKTLAPALHKAPVIHKTPVLHKTVPRVKAVAKVVKPTQVKKRPASKQASAGMKSVRASLEMWRKDWQSRDSDAYLSHYHKAFETAKHNYKSWAKYKRRVNAKKSYIKVRLTDVKISPNGRYTKRGEVVLVTFKQHYKSSNYNASSQKKLYMARAHAGEPWLILREE
ncbi:MAG: hypothetical protein Q9M16_09230 [Mariprofundus sp.]|nr:hypothetical protein [Mariprofundus sp.]